MVTSADWALRRDQIERMRILLNRLVSRGGKGSARAKKMYDELGAAKSAGDEVKVIDGLKQAAVIIRKNADDEDYTTFQDIVGMMPDEWREAIVAVLSDDEKAEKPKKQRLTVETLKSYLDAEGIELRRNLLTHRVELVGWNTEGVYSREQELEQFPVLLSDYLSEAYTNARPGDIVPMLAVVAGMREYNPVLAALDSVKWDGRDRIAEVCESLGITDALSKTLVTKWMKQAIALQYNDTDKPFGGEGVLVLAAKQGTGKSQFAEIITELPGTSGLFLPGRVLDPRDKDSVIQCTSRWVVELGELGSTLDRADMGRLKAFLTNPFDTYRVPYGREDTTVLRRTVFVATVDRNDFLTDDSGNRRWWVIDVAGIDLDRVRKIDKLQLWRQVRDMVERDGVQSFRLTPEERDELNARNTAHERAVPGEQELQDIIDEYEIDNGKHLYKAGFQRQTASAIIKQHDHLGRYTAQSIGKALKKLGLLDGTRDGKSVYRFPERKYRRTYTGTEGKAG